eukprot:CAMPEP_0196663716 /NCGR_PEP_ID=MMETSP1086-20130531/53939_1 /TAXON_ID=77921 /ORGANISM="Cyanoptyche  gloeocystis , Strain SAG4.97" /LENGTH=441 /DNA_ID=CAMNT_0041999635 /DNA_START=49 /DNA_END=1374 /DNA_ORIENTATION=+
MALATAINDILTNLDKTIEENKKLATEPGKLKEAVENMLAVEKPLRLACEMSGTTKACLAIVNMCFEAKDWKELNNEIVVISKRRAQLKQVITKVVQESMGFLDKITEKETKLELLGTLRTVTAGKIFVEIERARLTRTLAQMQEADGDVSQAAETLQEVQVETFGGMEKREKVDYLLEQVRLCLAKNDFVRGHIIAKKIQPKFLQDPEFQDLKLRYHELMIRYHSHYNAYLSMFQSYHAMYLTPSVAADKDKAVQILKNVVVLLVLSPHDPEQADMILRISGEKNLEQLPLYKSLLKYFSTTELVRWPLLETLYKAELLQLDIFAGDLGVQRWGDFAKRVVEHNIRVVSKYYSRISSARLSQLLDLSPEETEKSLSDMVTTKALYARTDRPKGEVSFEQPKQPSEVLNEWAGGISKVLDLVETVCHLIHKESVTHGIDVA